jgi:glycosyltransferase involved in cell wall biosynthesis
VRILQIINDLRVAGAETLCVQLAIALRERGRDAEVLVLRDEPSPLGERLRANGVPLRVSEGGPSLRSPRQIVALTRAMRGFDIVHVHLFPAQLYVAVAAARLPRETRPRLVTTEHNTFNRRRKPLFRPIDAGMYARYDEIVAISDATKDSLAAWAPKSAGAMRVIANGIDYDRFDSAPTVSRAALGLPPDGPLALCVGRLEAQKDQATLIRALPFVPGLHAVLAGAGPNKVALADLAAVCHVEDRVHFLGRRSDIPELMKAADIYVQPSLYEGFGLAVAEAMAAGLPVIISDVPGVREVVGDAGMAFPAGDVTSLAAAINAVLDDPEQADDFARRGKDRAREFTLERFLEKHVALYESLRPPPAGGSGAVL